MNYLEGIFKYISAISITLHPNNPATLCCAAHSCTLAHPYLKWISKYYNKVPTSALEILSCIPQRKLKCSLTLLFGEQNVRMILWCNIQQGMEIFAQTTVRKSNGLGLFALLPAIKSTFLWRAGKLYELQTLFSPLSHTWISTLEGESVRGESI